MIHIDADPRELGKLRRPELAIHADAGVALRALAEAVTPALRPEWLARVGELRRAYPLPLPGLDDVRRPYGLIRAVADVVGSQAAITTDVGQHQMWVAQSYPFTRADRWLSSGGLGTMGFGLPAAIGAALARPDAPVICFTGDGSLLMNIQELGTLAELGLDVKVVVLDNAALGLVRQQQRLFYESRHVGAHYARPADFSAIAEGFGVAACDLGVAANAAHARKALIAALRAPGPQLIRAAVAVEEMVLPMVAPGAGNTEVVETACWEAES